MNGYRVKEVLWVFICLAFLLITLVGCSSTPSKVSRSQYCYTSQDITVKDGERVSSETRVKCDDNPVQMAVNRNGGLADGCEEYVGPTPPGSQPDRGVYCRVKDLYTIRIVSPGIR